jgi:restriction system protein
MFAPAAHDGGTSVPNYYRVILGRANAFAQECFEGGFIGANFRIAQDLSGSLPEQWRDFNKQFIPVWLEAHPGKSKIAAGLSCGFLYTVAKGMRQGDVVLAPDGKGSYRVGTIAGDYVYAPGSNLPHRRPVDWLPTVLARDELSAPLRGSMGSIATVSTITKHAAEIEILLRAESPEVITSSDPVVEDPATFALERHLEDFLVQNWAQTELGKSYAIFEDENGTGRQYETDTGPIDILAISRDNKELLVVELKRGRASDAVVGQVLRYMGFVREELALPDQSVRGVIIALEDDQRLRRALAVTPSVDYFRYSVSFKLHKA